MRCCDKGIILLIESGLLRMVECASGKAVEQIADGSNCQPDNHTTSSSSINRYSFYYADHGGCFFLDPGGGAGGMENYVSQGGVNWVLVMPIAVKYVHERYAF